jgi:hypothetical protein
LWKHLNCSTPGKLVLATRVQLLRQVPSKPHAGIIRV